jgi:hypothetical protein
MASKVVDPLFKDPYVDVDEWRDNPVHHRYVHGGFKGTEARFSFYFPTKERYAGRFFQYITPAPSSENLAQHATGAEDNISFAISSGGYLIETNEGSLSAIAGDQTIPGYRVNASAAEYSRVLAAQMYGPHRPYGYAWGGSGGGFKTISGFENTETWDGVVPFVIGSPQAIPNVYTARLLALRILKDKFPSIVDAVEPGGSGDMYRALSPEEQSVLREVTALGFPPQGWFNYKTIGEGAFPVLFGAVRMLDHRYFEDFWKVPGYEGANPPESLRKARVQYRTTIKRIIRAGDPEVKAAMGGVNTAWQRLKSDVPVGYELDSAPNADLEGAFLVMKSGKATGKDFSIGRAEGNTVYLAVNPFGGESQLMNGIAESDEVQIDNSDFLAVQYYHRHQVPTPDFYVWDQFRGSDGKPLYPQRPILVGRIMTGAGSIQSGRFRGKMIVVESMMDQDAFPWQADWYRSKVKAAVGDRIDDCFRLYFTEHAIHGEAADFSRTVDYVGELHQALRDVSAWVEKNVSPPPSTSYKVVDGQVTVPPSAIERRGIQPVVHLLANGKARADIAAGHVVNFTAVVELPPNTGKIVRVEWDFDGAGKFAEAEQIIPTQANGFGTLLKIRAKHEFRAKGTYFSILRATSNREGDSHTSFGQIQNLGRVRVVVN